MTGIVAAVLAASAGSAYLLATASRRRRAKLVRNAANHLGLEFYADGHPTISAKVRGLRTLKGNEKVICRNCIVSESLCCLIGATDVRYTRNDAIFYATVFVVVDGDGLSLPPFWIRPQRFTDTVGRLFGKQDINFDSHHEFSKQFVLRSSAESATRNFLDDLIILDELIRQPEMTYEGDDQCFAMKHIERRSDSKPSLLSEELVDFFEFGVLLHRLLRERSDQIEQMLPAI